MVVRINLLFNIFFLSNKFIFYFQRYAKNSAGQVGVIPENYVQASDDPPEPSVPPPPPASVYPSFDGFNGNTNHSDSRSSNPPPYKPHTYMNPSSYGDTNWSSNNSTPWPSSPQVNVRYYF